MSTSGIKRLLLLARSRRLHSGAVMPKRSGFSLVEMLVVIAIVAIVLGILLPWVGVVRGRSARIACASNLSQVGKALMAYASSSRGYVPRFGTYPTPGEATPPHLAGGGCAAPGCTPRLAMG